MNIKCVISYNFFYIGNRGGEEGLGKRLEKGELEGKKKGENNKNKSNWNIIKIEGKKER